MFANKLVTKMNLAHFSNHVRNSSVSSRIIKLFLMINLLSTHIVGGDIPLHICSPEL